MIYGKRMHRCIGVCPDCGHHRRLTAHQRIRQLCDPGAWRPLAVTAHPFDPLVFTDTVAYVNRLGQARSRTGLDEAVVAGLGTIAGRPAVIAVMDFRFMGGSLGSAVGELITISAEAALRDRMPLVLVTASGGARMQEGAFSLMQMAKTSRALADLDQAGILTVSLVTDPTYGGVAASFASLTDVILAEPGARMGFAGPRVIEQTIRQRLPERFQTAEFLMEHGLVDDIVPRETQKTMLGQLLAAATERPAAPELADPVIRRPEAIATRAPDEVVRLARHVGRPTTLDYAHYLLGGFHEMHGDRASGDCQAIVGGVGRLRGLPVVLVGHQKGHTTRERVARNFGMASPAGHRKAARLMRLAAKLGLPVLALVDTPGAYPGPDAEEGGQAIAIAQCLSLMSTLPVPVVAVVTGEGGSGGALALAVADEVLACENAFYSVISPEGCAAILWKTPSAAGAAAAALRIDAHQLLRHEIVDGVIPEPAGGADRDHAQAAELLGGAALAAFNRLLAVTPAELVRARGRRFRRYGADACLGHEFATLRSPR
jgi:acetyl-CoA carboxylase carboxyl transferase beta subunit/acetyl-CoA carboxylase carboxyl transferase alpha subunit